MVTMKLATSIAVFALTECRSFCVIRRFVYPRTKFIADIYLLTVTSSGYFASVLNGRSRQYIENRSSL